MMVAKNVVGGSLIVRASLSERQLVTVNGWLQTLWRAHRSQGRNGVSEHQACTVNPLPKYLLCVQLDTCLQRSTSAWRAFPFFGYQKFYGTVQIPSPRGLEVGDEHIGPDGRSWARFKRLGKKKITDIDGKCYSFAGSDMRATAKQTCAVVVKSILLPHRHRSAIGTLQLVRLGNETPIRTPCNASRTLICKKHVQRRLHYTYCMYGKYILIIAL